MGLCTLALFTACKSQESAYKAAYEAAKANESAETVTVVPQEETVTLSENPSVVDAESNTTAQGYRMIYRKDRQGVSIEGDGATQRPTIVLPPIGGKVGQ